MLSSTGPDMDPGIARRADDRDMDPGIVHKPPGTGSVQAPPTATPKPRATEFGLTPDEYKAVQGGQTPVSGGSAAAGAPSESLEINTDNQAMPDSYSRGRAGNGQIKGIVLHSSDGNEASDTQTLTGHDPDHKVSAHYYVTKDGRIYQFVNDQDTAFHAGQTAGKYAGYNNNTTIGIEQEHVDGKYAWAPAQVAATARLVASLKAKYGLIDDNIMGHSDVAPERKQDPYNYPWKQFFAQVDTGKAADQQAPDKSENYISGRATTFGYKDQGDPGVGAPKLGGLSTNNTDLIGAAVPQEALQRYVSAHPADWRKARVEVVTDDGRRLLVPIFDLGPRDTSDERGVVADFTQALTNLTGNIGEQNYKFRIIPNAGPDVMKNPQEFADEQAAIVKVSIKGQVSDASAGGKEVELRLGAGARSAKRGGPTSANVR